MRRAGPWIATLAIGMLVVSCGGSASSGTTAPTSTTTSTPEEVDMGWVDERPIGSGPLVAIVGDSLTASSRDELTSELEGHSVLIGAIFGEGWAGGQFSSRFDADPPLIVEAALTYSSQDPEVMVIALGTTDARKPELEVEDSRANIDRVVAAIGDTTCLVVVEVDESVPRQEHYDASEAVQINERLAHAADVVVPWNDLTEAHPEWLIEDGIHLDDAGKRARSRLIADAVSDCTLG